MLANFKLLFVCYFCDYDVILVVRNPQVISLIVFEFGPKMLSLFETDVNIVYLYLPHAYIISDTNIVHLY